MKTRTKPKTVSQKKYDRAIEYLGRLLKITKSYYDTSTEHTSSWYEFSGSGNLVEAAIDLVSKNDPAFKEMVEDDEQYTIGNLILDINHNNEDPLAVM